MQVGPGLLVFGKLPSTSSLAVSLLERLHEHYKYFGEEASPYIHTLTTNFRSRREILELTGELFYDTKLRVSHDQEPPAHSKYSYPLVFVCSSVDDPEKEIVDNTNKEEAEIVIDTLASIIESWTEKHWGGSSLCVMSPSRAQVLVIVCFSGSNFEFCSFSLAYCY